METQNSNAGEVLFVVISQDKLKKGLAANSDSQRCCGQREEALHVIRDCSVAKEIWDLLLLPMASTRFLFMGLVAVVGAEVKIQG